MGDKLKGLLKKPIFWIAIAGVALFAVIRGRMAASAGSADTGQGQQPFTGGGAGGGGTDTGYISGGTSLQDQIAQQDIAAGQEKLRQGAALFNFDLQQKQRTADLLLPLEQAWEKTKEALQGNQTLLAGKIASQIGATKAQCAVGDAKVDPATGQLYCRTPQGGGFKPFQQIGSIFSGILQGAANAAPGITQGYLGKWTGFPSISAPTGGGQSQRQINPGSTTPMGPVRGQPGTSVTGISGGQFQIPSMWDTGLA